MERKPLLRIAGPVWEFARYFLVLALVATGSSPVDFRGLLSAPWLAAAAAGGLVMPAAFLMLSFDPQRYAGYLPLVRLGKGLEIVTVVLLFFSVGVAPGSAVPPLGSRLPGIGSLPVVLGAVAALDIAVLVGLFSVLSDRTTKRR
jgi:hypothetical protein